MSSLEEAQAFLEGLPADCRLNVVGVVPRLSGLRPPFPEGVVALYAVLGLARAWRGGGSSALGVFVTRDPETLPGPSTAGAVGHGPRGLGTWEQFLGSLGAQCEQPRCPCRPEGNVGGGAAPACERCLADRIAEASGMHWLWRGSLRGATYIAKPCGEGYEAHLGRGPFSPGSAVRVLDSVPRARVPMHQLRCTGVSLHPARPPPAREEAGGGAGDGEEVLLCLVGPGEGQAPSPAAVALVPDGDDAGGALRAYVLASREAVDGAIAAACAPTWTPHEGQPAGGEEGGGSGVNVCIPPCVPVVGASPEREALLMESYRLLRPKYCSGAPVLTEGDSAARGEGGGGDLVERWPELKPLLRPDDAPEAAAAKGGAPRASLDCELGNQPMLEAWLETKRQVARSFDAAGNPLEQPPACPESSAPAAEEGAEAAEPSAGGLAVFDDVSDRSRPFGGGALPAVKSAAWLLERLPDGDAGYASVPLEMRRAQGWRHEAARQKRLPPAALGSQVLHGVELFRPLAPHRRREDVLAAGTLLCEARCSQMGLLPALAGVQAAEVLALAKEAHARTRGDREHARKKLRILRRIKKKYVSAPRARGKRKAAEKRKADPLAPRGGKSLK